MTRSAVRTIARMPGRCPCGVAVVARAPGAVVEGERDLAPTVRRVEAHHVPAAVAEERAVRVGRAMRRDRALERALPRRRREDLGRRAAASTAMELAHVMVPAAALRG